MHGNQASGANEPSLLVDFLAGCLGGAAAVLVGQPLDTVKVKMQTDPQRHKAMLSCFTSTLQHEGLFRGLYAGTLPSLVASVGELAALFAGLGQCQVVVQRYVVHKSSISELKPTLTSILKSDGLYGLYRGLAATLLREVPGCFCFIFGYDAAKFALAAATGRSKQELGPLATLFSGGIAGVCFWTSIFPIDLVKSRVQVGQSSFWTVTKSLWRSGGIAIFYRGLMPCALRAFPSSAATFLVYEGVRDYFAGAVK